MWQASATTVSLPPLAEPTTIAPPTAEVTGFQRLVRHIIFTAGMRVASLGLGLASTVVIARMLGPSGQGVVAVLWFVGGLAVQLGNLGLHATATYFVAQERARLRPVVTLSVAQSALVGGVLALLLMRLGHGRPDWFAGVAPDYVTLFALAVPFMLAALFFQSTLLGLERIRAYNGIETGGRALLLLLLLITLVALRAGLVMAVVSVVATQILVCLGYGIALRRAGAEWQLRFPSGFVSAALGYGVKAYFTALFAFLVIRSDIFLVNYLRGTTAAGFYSVAVSLADQALLLPTIIGAMLFPAVARRQQAREQLTLQVSRQTVAAMLLLVVVLAVAARPVLWLLYGPAFLESAPAFHWLLPGIFLLSVEIVLAQHLAALGFPRALVYVWLAGFLLNLPLNLVLIPRWGIVGAAVASSLSYGFVFVAVLRMFLARTQTGLRAVLVPRPSELRQLFSRKPPN